MFKRSQSITVSNTQRERETVIPRKKAVSRPGCLSLRVSRFTTVYMCFTLRRREMHSIMLAFSEKLQDRVYHCQRTANDGTRASSGESADRCRAIMYAIFRVMDAHERRD